MSAILSAQGVSFRTIPPYPQIDIAEGRATFIQGASGCGKSTLLKLFNATLTPDCGALYYRNRDLVTLDTIWLRREVLLLGQTAYLFDGTIRDNFRMYYEYRGDTPCTDTQIEQYLSLCQVAFTMDASCDTMSGGERQRVYLAIGLSLKPNVLLLDEPTSALDVATAHTLLHHCKQFCREHSITLVVVSHDLTLADRYADAVIHLEMGAM